MKIVLFRDKRGQWRFRAVARNHKIIAQSEGYTRKANALKAVRLLRQCHLCGVIEE
jgi:uncharacterized protein YegP (UPF0339 family)